MTNVGTSWHNVKHHAARAWSTTNKILSAADRYADIAHRVLNTGLLGQQAARLGRQTLGGYSQARHTLEDYRTQGERMYGKVKMEVPEFGL